MRATGSSPWLVDACCFWSFGARPSDTAATSAGDACTVHCLLQITLSSVQWLYCRLGLLLLYSLGTECIAVCAGLLWMWFYKMNYSPAGWVVILHMEVVWCVCVGAAEAGGVYGVGEWRLF